MASIQTIYDQQAKAQSDAALPALRETNENANLTAEEILRREDDQYWRRLQDKNLAELMKLHTHLIEITEERKAVILAVKSGDLNALRPYLNPDDQVPKVKIVREDDERVRSTIASGNMRDKKFVGDLVLTDHKTPAEAVETEKSWLKKTFPTLKTDVLLVKDEEGKSYLAYVGVSRDEVAAASNLELQQNRAERYEVAISKEIKHRLNEASKSNNSPEAEESPKPLTTPKALGEASGPGSPLRIM